MSLWHNVEKFSSIITAPEMRIGTNGNYTIIDTNGDLSFTGVATVWDDLPPIPLTSRKSGGPNVPTYNIFISPRKLYTFAVNDDIDFEYEFVHPYKEGSSYSIHLHWATNGTEGTSKFVKWEVGYTVSNGGATPPFTSAYTTYSTIATEVEIPANTPDRAKIISSFGLVSGTGLKIGAYIIGTIKRIASTGAAPAANPFGIALGVHIEQDTIGSKERFSK